MASGNEPTDEELVRQTLSGNREAFSQIIGRYQHRIYHLAYQMCRDRDLADDWAQEVFLRAFRQLARFDPVRPFPPWLFRLATNVCLNEARRVGPPSISLDETTEDGEPRWVPDPGPTPEVELESADLRRQVQRAIDCLPEKYRLAIWLRHMEDLDYGEIAKIMNLPLGTVKTYLHRGREQLREILKPHLEGGE